MRDRERRYRFAGERAKFCLLAPPNDHRSLRSPVTRRLKCDTFKRCGGQGEGV